MTSTRRDFTYHMADQEALAAEEAALAALVASPLVKGVHPMKNGSGYYANLWCLKEHPRRASEQCQYSSTRTTAAQCYRDLLARIEAKHSSHLAAAEAAKAAAEAAAEEAPAAGPSNAFAAIISGQGAQLKAQEAAAAEGEARAAREAKRAVERQLEEASKLLDVAEKKAQELEEAAEAAREAAGLPRKKQRGEEQSDKPSWRGWSTSKWHEMESKEQARRAVPIDRERNEIVAPSQGGDETLLAVRVW